MSFAYMPLYTGDYLRDTRHLSCSEHGIYLLLLMYCWDSKGPVPTDERKVMGICGARSGDELEAARRVLSEFFIRMDDGWYNRRMQLEIERSESISQARSAAGSKGYQARAKQLPSKSLARASNPTPIPILSPDQIKTKNTKPKKLGADAPFVLPEWIPQQHWDAWVEARTKARKPPTEYAKKLAVMKLENFREQGHPPAQVLMQAAFNGWSGLYPPKEVK